MLVWEGGKLLDQHVLPMVPGLSQFYGGPACPAGQTRDPVTGACVQTAPMFVGGAQAPAMGYGQAGYGQQVYNQQAVLQQLQRGW
jgi:hypothetical protein